MYVVFSYGFTTSKLYGRRTTTRVGLMKACFSALSLHIYVHVHTVAVEDKLMATTVKSFIDKAFSTLTRRRPQPQLESISTDEQELHAVTPKESSSSELSSTPSPLLSPVEPIGPIEADDILFRKNNVYLKHPLKKTQPHSSSLLRSSRELSLSSSLGESVDSSSSKETSSVRSLGPDNQELTPGFLFITTRGSDFGTTLILNWAPNCSIVPPNQAKALSSRASKDARSSSLSANNSITRDVEEECSSVSIDLGLMEVIRIFYRIDEGGLIISGEMVITSKERKFKVGIVYVKRVNII